jgi:hypothetical protein
MTYGIRQIRKVRSILRPETTPKSAAARSVWHTKEWADMQVAIMDALKPQPKPGRLCPRLSRSTICNMPADLANQTLSYRAQPRALRP